MDMLISTNTTNRLYHLESTVGVIVNLYVAMLVLLNTMFLKRKINGEL